MHVNTATDGNKLNLVSLEMTAGTGNPDRIFTFDQLIPAQVTDYLSVPENDSTDMVAVLGTPDQPPAGSDRLNLISDAALNTGIFNPSGSATGMTISFPRPVVNGPDHDVVFFDFSTGSQTPDPIVVMQPGGVGIAQSYASARYTKSASIGASQELISWAATVPPGTGCDFNQLQTLPLTAGAAGNQKWWAVPIDLTDLGVPAGGIVNSLVILSGDGSRAVDPLMIVAMPTPPLLGDFDRDGQLTSADISAMLKALTDLDGYQKWAGLSIADLLAIGDLDGDQSVTNADLQALLRLVANQSSPNSVPEPHGYLLGLLGVFCIMQGLEFVRPRTDRR